MGACNFFCRSMPRTQFLLKALAKESSNTEFNGSEEVDEAVRKLKVILKQEGMTFHPIPDFNEEYMLVVDSSLEGFGAVFGIGKCEDEKVENFRPVAFGSGAFESKIKLESSRNRELIGIQRALSYFRDLLSDAVPLTVICDHKSISNINNNEEAKKYPITRVRKALSEYPNLKIKYASAKDEIVQICDGLSRAITISGKIDPVEIVGWMDENLPDAQTNNMNILKKYKYRHFSEIALDENKLKIEQRKDKFCLEILSKSNNKNSWNIGPHEYAIKNSLILK